MNDEAARQGRPARRSTTADAKRSTGDGLSLVLLPEALEQLVGQVAERVRAELDGASPWLDRRAAAEYLSLPPSNLEKRRDVPCHRVGARVLYDRRELDEWARAQ
jgi:hypothetical protein